MDEDDQPTLDPGPIPPEPTTREPPLPIGDPQPNRDPGPIASERIVEGDQGRPGQDRPE